jgi:hypothetical protein
MTCLDHAAACFINGSSMTQEEHREKGVIDDTHSSLVANRGDLSGLPA